MACTFPAVIIFQFAALPLAVIIMGVALLAIQLIDPTNGQVTSNPAVVGVSIALVLAEFGVFGGMSLLGFIEGWRTGWLVGGGRDFRSAISTGPSAQVLRRLRFH
jgi:hypothetical protein